MKEIERKYLVEGEENIRLIKEGRPIRIRQGYLNRDRERVVRVRIKGDSAYLTIKGATKGIERAEFEYKIPKSDAEELLQMAEGNVIDKTRWEIDYEGYLWEVDEFHGALEGLVIAEVELTSVEETPALPPFAGPEVSDDPRYFNSNLCGDKISLP